MKEKLTSLWVRMLLPVIAMTLFVVILLTTLFSRSFITMVLRQENEKNAASFGAVSRTIPPLIDTAVNEVRSALADERVMAYAALRYSSDAELMHMRIACRDYLKKEIARSDAIFGILFMREDGSLFGVLPEGNFFLDDPKLDPLPRDVIDKVLSAPLGQTVWAGPLPGKEFYGFETGKTPRNIVIAAWKNVNVRYGECYALMLMDETVFEGLFTALQDGQSTWYLITNADRKVIYRAGPDAQLDPETLIRESNTGNIFRDGNGRPYCAFSMPLDGPNCTVIRVVAMEEHELVSHRVRSTVVLIALAVFLIALAVYRLWLRRFTKQFNSLLGGIKSMGQGDLEPRAFVPTSISEFKQMQREIDRTGSALKEQMETIRRMERERMELEAKRKEQELIERELNTARQIQESMLPHIFPPFPDRKEIDLYALMDPARDVGGDFYDFYFIDPDHLCLTIADVSGKGIPGAMFMMFSKRIIGDAARKSGSPAEILRITNETLCENNQAGMFVTVWLGILEISTGKLTAANAGHEYPVIRRKGGDYTLFKDRHGFVIGAYAGMPYSEYELTLSPGDRIFVYTDGVPEATRAGGEMFGTERMTAALNTCPDGGPEEALKAVRAAVDAFVGDAEQFDDLTMMCLEYLGPGADVD